MGKIYLDAPLLSFSKFRAAKSAAGIGPWFATRPKDDDWSGDKRMPVNMAEAVARAGIPVLLLYGGKDDVVPPDHNCRPFAAAFKAAKGKIEVHERAAYGHHPHGADPGQTMIIDFFTK